MKKLLKIIFFIFVCQSAGIIGSIFTTGSIDAWYSTLTRPSFSPPNWLFAPAWLTLYTLMGIALYLVWQKRGPVSVKIALWFFFIHLALNALWSILFFGLQNPALAFVEIVVLWAMILIIIIKFSRISKLAAWLLVPYLAWVSFASILNYSIWQLNL